MRQEKKVNKKNSNGQNQQMGQSIQEYLWKKICGRQPLKNLKDYGLL